MVTRLTGVASAHGIVQSFREVPGARVWDVPLPSVAANPAGAHTLQAPGAEVFDRWGGWHRDPVQPRLARLSHARLVTTDGAVVAGDGLLVGESLLDVEHLRRSFTPPPRVRRARQLSGEWASLLSPWSGNYFHWMIDCFPRLAVLQEMDCADLPLVVRGPLASFQRVCLAAVGAEFTCMTDDDHVAVDELVWASPPANVNFPTAYLVDWLRTTLSPGGSAQASRPSEPRRCLFVGRSGSRRILNEPELVDALRPMGFEYVRPEALGLEEQVKLFSQAGVVVGAHGAGLTNMVFAPPSTVLELFPPERIGWHYYMLAQAAGHDYWYIIGQDADRHVSVRAHDFVVDVELVARTVDAMLSARDVGVAG